MGIEEIKYFYLPKKEDAEFEFSLEKLERLAELFEKEDFLSLRNLSSELIKVSVIRNSKALANVAVIAYALAKILSKSHYVLHKNWPKNKELILDVIRKIIKDAKEKKISDSKELAKRIYLIAKNIENLDRKFGRYIVNVVHKARIKLASDCYFLGYSLTKSASFLGADIKELSKYLANVKEIEEFSKEKPIKEKVRELEKILG